MMTCCFYFPAKNKSLKFTESTHKRKLSVWKRTEWQVCECAWGKKIYEAGRDRKKWSSLLPAPPLLPHPLFHFLYFLLRDQHCRLGPWDRERLSGNKWQRCQPEKRKKGGMRRELGARFDPCLLINLQSKIEGGQTREKERQGERETAGRESPQRSSPGGVKCRSIAPAPPSLQPPPPCSTQQILPVFIYLS